MYVSSNLILASRKAGCCRSTVPSNTAIFILGFPLVIFQSLSIPGNISIMFACRSFFSLNS